MTKRIFSGKDSQNFWDAVSKSKSDILYEYGCKAQEIESLNADLLEVCKELVSFKAYELAKAAIAKAKKEGGK